MTEHASRRALVVRGGWPGHHPVEATDLFLPFLSTAGFEVTIEATPAVYADSELMASIDVVVQCVTMGEITDAACSGLREAVAAGAGLVGWHGGIADSYRGSADYLQLVGGQFAAHPGYVRPDGEDTAFVPHSIDFTALQHPITAGLTDFDLETEQYWVLADDYNDVLATTTQAVHEGDPWSRPVVSPAVWTRCWGAGRIVVATPGHDLDVLSHPTVRTIVERGMLWAARPPRTAQAGASS